MLRIKRSVAAAFSQQHFNTSVIDATVMAGAPPPGDGGAKRKREGEDSMAALEAAAVASGAEALPTLQPGTRVKGFVSAGVIQQGNTQGGEGEGAAAAAPANPEELDLGEEEEGGGGEGGEAVELQQQAVPEGVFGSLAKRAKTGDGDGGS